MFATARTIVALGAKNSASLKAARAAEGKGMTEEPRSRFWGSFYTLSNSPSSETTQPVNGVQSADRVALPASDDREAKFIMISRDCLIADCFARCLCQAHGGVIESFPSIRKWLEAGAIGPPPLMILVCGFGSQFDTELESHLAALIASSGDAPVVILSDIDDIGRMQSAFELGIRGYIPSNVPLDVALSAVRVVEVGGTFAPASSVFELKARKACAREREPSVTKLTSRQVEVGEAIRQGKANKQIAHDLDMTESTVKVHIRTLMRKFNVKNRTEVAIKMKDWRHGK